MSVVEDGLRAVRQRIALACADCGREPASVRLVAVSKFHPASAIREAYQAGQREFGESYAQELCAKVHALQDLTDLRFHFIGGLQRNKLKLLVPTGCVVETLASMAAARTLDLLAAQHGVAAEVLVQVNVSGESQKSGVTPQEVPALVQGIRSFAHLRLVGLMTIPKAGDASAARSAYRALRGLAEQYALSELSMGMSDDLEEAIAEGATIVRVGTAIFGPRPAISVR